MSDSFRQIALLTFGSIMTALIGSGVSALQHISDDVSALDKNVALIVYQIGDHERRISNLEKNLAN